MSCLVIFPAHKESFNFTHVVALQYLPSSDSSKHYGLTLSKPGDYSKVYIYIYKSLSYHTVIIVIYTCTYSKSVVVFMVSIVSLIHNNILNFLPVNIIHFIFLYLTILLQLMVEEVSKDSSAFYSGVKFGDRICMYCTVSTTRGSQMKKLCSILNDLEIAFTCKESVRIILVIQRS